jgi:hypothetical protein
MDNISFIENENSLVLLFDKSNLDKKKVDLLKRFFFLQSEDISNISFVSDAEQMEIEEILENPDCNDFSHKKVIEI